MRGRIVLALALALVAVVEQPARAQGFNQVGFNVATAAVTLTTTTEAVVITAPAVTVARPNAEVCIVAYAELTTGADTTAVVARIRRGASVSGTLVSEENEQNVKAAAASIEPFTSMVCEPRSGVDSVIYSLTLDQVGATGNGSSIYAAILVLVR